MVLGEEPGEEYKLKMAQCLAITGFKVIPFCGYLINELKTIKQEDTGKVCENL